MALFLEDVRQGDDYSVELIVKDASGNPQNITGYKFWLTFMSSFDLTYEQAELKYVKDAGDDENDNVANGICYIYIPAEDTQDIPIGSYYYALQQRAGVTGGVATVLPPIESYKDRIKVVANIKRPAT